LSPCWPACGPPAFSKEALWQPSSFPPVPTSTTQRQAKELLQAGKASALHDAQTILAREYGFPSWNALRDHVEAVTLEFDAALAEFLESSDGRPPRPGRTDARAVPEDRDGESPHSACPWRLGVRGRAAQEDPSLATKPGGPRGWEPIHYICYTSMAHDSPVRSAGLAAIARRLIALAPIRTPGFRGCIITFAGRCCGRVAPSAIAAARPRVARRRSRSQRRREPSPSLASAADIPVLEALLAHGANVDQAWATDGSTSLYAILNWSRTPTGDVAVEHGADPNVVFAENGERRCTGGARVGCGVGRRRWSQEGRHRAEAR